MLLVGLLALATNAVIAQEEKVLNVYNWTEYIAEDTIAEFEKETGIKVIYDVFDSNEVLEAKLLSGNTGFDIVAPSHDFYGRQITAGVYQQLDRSKLTNWDNLDPKLLATLDSYDPGNLYGIPYMWGTTGIGYNVNKVKEILGEDADLNSWSLVFDPEIAGKLSQCGIAFLDAPSEVIAAMLNYMGKDPNSTKSSDYKGEIENLMEQLRPNVRYFHSSQYINDLASGDICVAIGWSGDVLMAGDRAAEADNGVELEYIIPKEGAGVWFDMFAIPKEAKHPENAHAFINYVLRPEVIAKVTDFVWYANPNIKATALIDPEIAQHQGIYPNEDAAKNLYGFVNVPPKVERTRTRLWTKFKTGR
ncbi:extracellular solute-binding protein [Agarivorans sp. MS3-6]|uniref:extracellular solute-binding protein n=1 Tax=Agarivorans sp. TSD2052 TaxID=2937286 RepID=UPI00200C2F72|nr:extracellular solute-binding protein [Agarivorans sp. TSD2052]UPW20757.1 extracellular solute-binding protein [Agarivorans sp. TSD2052]